MTAPAAERMGRDGTGHAMSNAFKADLLTLFRCDGCRLVVGKVFYARAVA